MQLQMYRAFNSMAEGSTMNSERLRTIERKLPTGKEACKISVFYHVTNSANETSIKQDRWRFHECVLYAWLCYMYSTAHMEVKWHSRV